MAARRATAFTPRAFGATNPHLAREVATLEEARWRPAMVRRPRDLARRGAYRLAPTAHRALRGRLAHTFADDYFDRMHLTPTAWALGNVVSVIVREVAVWNAWRTRVATLTALTIEGDPSIALAPERVPVAFAPGQERTWTVTVADQGPPRIEAQCLFVFAHGERAMLTLVGQRVHAWTWSPNWREPLVETLAWRTDVQIAFAGTVTRTPLRDAPRRTWEFSVLLDGDDRRGLEHALFDGGARTWALPIFVDTTWLRAPVPVGAQSLACETAGLDWTVGGLAILWRSAEAFEWVEVATLSAQGIGLRAPTRAAWPIGTRLAPCRTARLSDASEVRHPSDRLVEARLRFEAAEPCDWPARLPVVRYRGLPVLEDRNEWSEAPTTTYARRTTVIDGEVGRTRLDDASGFAWPTRTHAWRLFGRAARAAHRSLLYGLQGRAEPVWMPTWTDDLAVIETVGETSLTLTVAVCGITRHLRQQAGRRHLRLELTDGTVFYRAVEASSEHVLADGQRVERLRIDAALGRVVRPEQFRLVCWLALATLAGDTVELRHHADSEGLLDCAVSFAGIPAEEP